MADSGIGLEEWTVPAATARDVVELAVPVDVPGWEERPWVKLRPLTDEEALRRESVGVYEEYCAPTVDEDLYGAVVEEGPVIRRRYDLWAMAEFDYRHCLVDFRLPERTEEGSFREVRLSRNWDDNLAFLRRLPPRLAEWLGEMIAAVNLRTPEATRLLLKAKKN